MAEIGQCAKPDVTRSACSIKARVPNAGCLHHPRSLRLNRLVVTPNARNATLSGPQQIGIARETAYLKQIKYGNAVATGSAPFWVEGDLAISAHEQIAFLRKLYRNELGFRIDHQRLVKDVLINEAGKDWVLRAKTGWSGKIGWWVGWVEWPTGPVFFALNIDTPNRLDDLPKRIDITRNILRSIDALPR